MATVGVAQQEYHDADQTRASDGDDDDFFEDRTSRSSRRALRRVAAASIGHSTIQPTAAKNVWVAAIPARMASGVSLDNATATPTAAPTATEMPSRGTAGKRQTDAHAHKPQR